MAFALVTSCLLASAWVCAAVARGGDVAPLRRAFAAAAAAIVLGLGSFALRAAEMFEALAHAAPEDKQRMLAEGIAAATPTTLYGLVGGGVMLLIAGATRGLLRRDPDASAPDAEGERVDPTTP